MNSDEILDPLAIKIEQVEGDIIENTDQFQYGAEFDPMTANVKKERCDNVIVSLGDNNKAEDFEQPEESQQSSRNVLHKFNQPMIVVRTLDKKENSCKICNQIFKNTFCLRKHIKKFHKKEKLYSTNMHTYGSGSHFTTFECARCNASFYEENKIEEHVILTEHNSSTTSKNSGYFCSDCQVSFSTISLLKKHFSSQHQDKTVNACALCRTPFLKMTELKHHYKVQHGID